MLCIIKTLIQAGNATETRHAFVPKDRKIFSYDAAGNLTQDGRWIYEWNGENRLTRMTACPDVPGPHYQLTFQYDWMGRRIRKTVVDTDTSQTISDLIFLYDGWNLIAEVNAQTGELVRTYVWGLDLSGTFQGVGVSSASRRGQDGRDPFRQAGFPDRRGAASRLIFLRSSDSLVGLGKAAEARG